MWQSHVFSTSSILRPWRSPCWMDVTARAWRSENGSGLHSAPTIIFVEVATENSTYLKVRRKLENAHLNRDEIQTWSRGWPQRDLGASLETYQVGAHFEALDEGVLVAPLDPRCTQVVSNLVSVQVWTSAWIYCKKIKVYQRPNATIEMKIFPVSAWLVAFHLRWAKLQFRKVLELFEW